MSTRFYDNHKSEVLEQKRNYYISHRNEILRKKRERMQRKKQQDA